MPTLEEFLNGSDGVSVQSSTPATDFPSASLSLDDFTKPPVEGMPVTYSPEFVLPEIPKYPQNWSDNDEKDFKEWYKGWAEEAGINPNPDDPRHKYDYRSAYKAGAFPTPQDDGKLHWPSQFKHPDHPNRYVNGVDTITGKPDPALMSSVGSIADAISNKAKALARGGAAGLTTGLAEMGGQVTAFLGHQFARIAPTAGAAIEQAGDDLTKFMEEKEKEWFAPDEGTAVDRMVYQAGKMLAPSIIPAGAARAGLGAIFGIGKKMAEAKKLYAVGDWAGGMAAKTAANELAAKATKFASAIGAGFFGLAQAGDTQQRGLETAKELEAEGKFDEAKKVRDMANGLAPLGTGIIEAIGEYLGTKYLAKFFKLDEAEAFKRGGRELLKDFLKTLGVEVSTEMGQGSGEAAIEVAAGISPPKTKSELLSAFGDETPISSVLAAALDAVGPTVIMTLLTGGFGVATNLGKKSKKDLLKDAAANAGVPEEDILPKPDSILRTMGAMPPAGEGAATEAATRPEEPTEPTVVFGSMPDAEQAGIVASMNKLPNGTMDQIVAWTMQQEQANQDAKFFLATGQRAKGYQSLLQYRRITRAIEAAKNPEQFGAEKKEEEAKEPTVEDAGAEKLKLEPITLGGEQTRYGVNPSTNQITGLMKKSHEGYLRGMLDKNGDFYVWDAYHATHGDFMHLLNLDTPDFGGMFETYFLIADKADQKRAGQDIPEWEGNVSTPEEAYQTAQRRRKEIEDANEYAERMEKEAEEGKERMTPSAAVRAILGDEGEKLKLEKSYSKAPDNLMGIAKEPSRQKGYDEQNYKFSLPVKVTFKDGTVHEDEIKGLNKAHALERARRNWEGAEVEALPVPAIEKPITAPKRVMDMHGAIVEEEESTGQAFDFRNKRDRAWLASLGYSERDIDSAERWARKAWKPGQPTKLREPAEATAKAKAQPISPKVLDNKVTSEGGYAYHATNSDRLQDIAATGELKTNKPNAYTDQNVWPDGATEKRAYFSNDAGVVWQFAPEDGTPVLVRTKSEGLKTESTGDRYSTKPIKAADLEYLGQDNKWHPVVELATPTAKFAGWQEVPNKEPLALYHIVGGPSDKSTVSAAKLKELGIEIPETPAVPKKEVSKPETPKKEPKGKTNIEIAEEGEKLKLEEVTVEPLYKAYGVTRDVQILTNPSTSALQGFVARSNSGLVRAFITRDGEFIVWDAHDAIHAEMAEALGLRANDLRNEFYIKDRTVFGQSDLAQDYDVFNPESAVKYWRNFVESGEKLKLERLPIFRGAHSEVPTLVNPTTTAVNGLLKKSQGGVLRGVMDVDGNLYVWDAYDAIHRDYMDYLGWDNVVSCWVVGETINSEQLRREVPEWFDSTTGMPMPGVVTPKGLMDAHYATKNDLEVLLLGGEGGYGAPISMLRIAQELEKKFPGDRKLVWKKTGWVRGPGGKWRFEIDDSKATIKNPGKGTMNKVPLEERGWRYNATRPQLIDRGTHTLNTSVFGWRSPIKLTDVLTHDELFYRYPQLKNVTVVVDPDIKEGGYWDPAAYTIGISDNQFTRLQELVDTLFHEVQHVIQTIEGFPQGTSIRREYDALKDDPRHAGLTPTQLWQMAFDRYEKNAGENESIDTQARLTMSAKKKANVPPYDRAEELVGATTSAWIIREPGQSTAFQIDTNRGITKSMLDFHRGAKVMGEVADFIREALKAAGFDKFPELMARVEIVLQPYVKVEKVSKKTIQEYMDKYQLTEAQVLEMIEQQKIKGSQKLSDPVHALIKMSYLLNQNREDWNKTALHEMWHVVEDFFFTDEEKAEISKFIASEEDRADKFAEYVFNITEREKFNSTLSKVFDRIIWFLKELRARLLGANIRSAEELFDYVRRGKLRPKLLENSLKYQKLTGVALTRAAMKELTEIHGGKPEDWVPPRLTEDATPATTAEAKARVKKLVVEWMRPEQLSLDNSGWTPPKNEADIGAEDRTIPKVLEMPEILRIYKALMGGKLPAVRKLLFGREGIRGVFIPGKGTVRLKAENFRDPNLAARILSHEIGHIIDWLPNFMIQGNILGKISGLKTWLINTLPFKPGAPGPLTDEDKKRLREEAIKLLGVKQELRTKYIDTSLYEDIKISPEDVLKIWNAVENSRLLNPELYKYIAGLDTDAEKLIIKAALKGNLTPELEQFVKRVRVGPETKQQVTEVVYKQPTQEEILKKLAELIEKEIKIRQLWVEEEVRDELMALSARWRPWDPAMGTPWYNQIYRPSAEELYADAISALFNDPQFLKAQAPRFYEAFFNYLDAKKDFKKIYLEIQREIHSGEYRQNRIKALYEMWDHGNEVYGLQYEKEKISLKDDALRAAFDAFHFILRDVRKVGEENIPDQFNPRFKLEEMVYTPSEIEGMLTVLYRNVIKPLEKAGLKWDREFGVLTYLMRVAFDKTIQGQAHPGGWDKQMAIEQLNFMKEHQLTPTQWAALKEAAKAFRKIHEEFFIDKAEDAEVYDKEMIKRFRDNDTYATWDVMPYLEARYGRAVATRVFKPIGTLQDIPNPATATIMKDVAFIKAVNHNIAVKTVVKFYQDYANILGVDMKEAPVVWRNGRREIEEPDRDSPYGLVVYLHKGEAKGVWLPKDIAEALHTNPVKYTFLARVLRGLTNPMRQIFTNLNYGFWIVNAFFRDAQRLVMALPGWNVGKFAKHWLSGLRPAFRSTFAIPDDVVLEMQKNNMLISVTDMHDLTDEDTQIERLLRLYAVKGPGHYSEKVQKPWGHLMNYVTNRLKLAQFYFEATGRALERTTKIGAYTYLTENFPDMSKEMIGHIVRTRGGSPDFWRAGREQSLLNNLLMFFNAQKEGYRGDFEAYKDNPGEYLSKKLVFTVLPKLLMYAGFLGLLGAAVKDIFDGVSEYDLTNYFIVPLGRTSTGRVVYWRIPLDEFSRLVGGTLWKALRTIPIPSTSGRDESVALGEGITHLMDYAAGQVPTVSPLIGVLMDVVEYASGINPYDTFYGRHAIGDVEFQAKDSRAREQFLKYVIEKMGGSIVYKFKHDKVEKIAEELESILGFPVHSPVADLMLKAPDQPVVSNILGRFLKVSNFGEREKLLKLKDKVKTENARVILDAREAAYALVDGKQLTNAQVLAMAQKPDVLNRQMMLSLARKYGMVYFEEWLSAGTTKEKWAVLSKMLEKNALNRQDANVSAPPLPGALPSASSTTNSQYPPLSVEKETNK